jgi:hypothetical protein
LRALTLAFLLAAVVPAGASAITTVPDTTPPSCVVAQTATGFTLTAQDTGSGIDSINIVALGETQFNFSGLATPTAPFVGTVTKPAQGAYYASLALVDFAGNKAFCEYGQATAATLCTLLTTIVQNSTAYGETSAFARSRADALVKSTCGLMTVPGAQVRRLATATNLALLKPYVDIYVPAVRYLLGTY